MAEPSVQVPVSLIERAPHERKCASFSWNGVGWDNDPAACDCWKAEALSQPTPSVDPKESGVCHCGTDMDAHTWADGHNPVDMIGWTTPRIEGMAPGTTFTAEFTASGFNGERTRWLRDEHGLVLASTGLRISAFSIDPSTIRDVTPPKEPTA